MSGKTAEQILDITQELIMTRGYNAFSYSDLARRLNIRTASIHYHYATKAELGRAVIARYRKLIWMQIEEILSEASKNHWDALDHFVEHFRCVSAYRDQICLCASLAGEYGALSEEMQIEVRGFFEEQQKSLTELLEAGKEAGDFQFLHEASKLAQFFYSALQGGLLIGRAREDLEQLENCIEMLLMCVGERPLSSGSI